MSQLSLPPFAVTFPRQAKKPWYRQTFKKLRYQFFLSTHYHQIKAWREFIDSDERYVSYFSNQMLYGKYCKLFYDGYIDRRLNVQQRFDMVYRDMQFATDHLPKDFFDPNCWQKELVNLGDDLSIVLQKNRLNVSEGIWTIGLFYQQQRVYIFSFSVGMPDTLIIGSIQGANNEASKELIKRITKQMHGLRPQQLMIWLAWQMANILGLSSVQGVATINHPKMTLGRRMTKNQVYKTNYDDIWQSYDATQLPNGNWQIPALSEKPLEQIESKKRSMYRKRYEMMDMISKKLTQEFF